MKTLESVLLIDDDPVHNFLSLRLLKTFGLTKNIQTCLNGDDAIHFLERHCVQEGKKCPDLILLDLNMPIMNGFEFLNIYNKLKFKKDHVEIAILTSSEDVRDARRVQSFGINNFLNKPLISKTFKDFLDLLSGQAISTH